MQSSAGRTIVGEPGGNNVCRLYDYCVNERKLEHCGMCSDLPCEVFLSSHDPSLSAEEARQDIENRQRTLLRRRQIGTEVWLR
ncbi:MAG: DUF3795 domain-containing protein, partial [Bacillota bacterium]